MSSAVHNRQWEALSEELSGVIETLATSIVSVHGRRRLAGSGIHWRTGLIVTANHVLGRDNELSISRSEQSSSPATLVGRDPSTDVAVLKVADTTNFPTVQTTTTEGLRVGHVVIAVGRSHLGDLAASAGIVARLGGAWKTWRNGDIDQLVRPDVTLYPGQSGSALANSQGQVLGMNTAALARMAAITVPSATVDRVVGELLEHGHIRRSYLGLAMQTVSIPEEVREKLSLESTTGLLVMHVVDGGPSSKAGVMLGDLIIAIQSKATSDLTTLQSALAQLRTGDQTALTVLRGGEKRELIATLGDRPSRE